MLARVYLKPDCTGRGCSGSQIPGLFARATPCRCAQIGGAAETAAKPPAQQSVTSTPRTNDCTGSRRAAHHTTHAVRKERLAATPGGSSRCTHLSAAMSRRCMVSTWSSPAIPPATTMRPALHMRAGSVWLGHSDCVSLTAEDDVVTARLLLRFCDSTGISCWLKLSRHVREDAVLSSKLRPVAAAIRA